MTIHTACLLLGSNIQPEYHLKQAVILLNRRLDLQHLSSVWETPAVGSDGPNFLNAAALVATPLDHRALKDEILRPIEAQLGRVRSADKFAPRNIDIDPILYDGMPLDANLEKYAYAAVPVAELLPRTRVNSGEYLKDVAASLLKSQSIYLRPDVLLQSAIE
jgi:2-amino-4-hydroxy-6-hydroxymethyldihydropteridine diphosphokinase